MIRELSCLPLRLLFYGGILFVFTVRLLRPCSLTSIPDKARLSFETIEQMIFRMTPYETKKVASPLQCLQFCTRKSPCHSANVLSTVTLPGKFECQLINTTRHTRLDLFAAEPGAFHYSVLSECSLNPALCRTGCTCLPYSRGINHGCVCESTMEYQVSKSQDDASYIDCNCKFNKASMSIKESSKCQNSYGFQFRSINLNQGMSITKASFEILGKPEDDEMDIDVYISIIDTSGNGERVRNCKFASITNSPSLKWNIRSTSEATVWFKSPDISNLISTITNNASWQNGGTVTVILSVKINVDDEDSDPLKVYTYDDKPNHAAVLKVHAY